MDISILGVVVAGGQASRMNYIAKGLTQYQGKALIEYPLAALDAVSTHVMVNANDLEAYQNLGVPVFADDSACHEKGPLSGIYAALLKAQELGVTHLLISPCDTPCVSHHVFELLKQSAQAESDTLYYIESDSGIQPLHAIMPVAGLAEKLEQFLAGQARVMLFYRNMGAKAVYWQEEGDFLNINYLAQLS